MMPKKTTKTKVERKLDLLFELCLHIANKVCDETEMQDLQIALQEVNDQYHQQPKVN